MIRLDELRNAPGSTGAERPLASLFAQSVPSAAIMPEQPSVASLGALVGVKPQDGAGAAKPIPAYVAPAIEAALGVRSPDLSNISYHDLTSWKEISQVKPPISQEMQNAFSDSSSVGASFKDNGTTYSLVSQENLDIFSKLFGLSEWDALEYVSTQEITHGFLFNHYPEMKIRENERVAETVTATKYPEVAVAFAAYSDAYGANRNNYLLLRTEVQTAAGTALREAGVKPKFEKDSDKFIGMDFLNGFTKWADAQGILPDDPPRPYTVLLKEYLGVYLREKGVADADPAEVQRSIQDRYVRALQAGARKDLGEAR